MNLLQSLKSNFFELLNIVKTIKQKGSFAQNFSFTFSANLFGMFLSLIFAPIMSRIYPPEAYGTFSVYTAIIGNVSTLSLLMYNIALLIPKEEEKFHSLLRLSFVLNVIFGVFFSLITITFSNKIIEVFGLEKIGNLIYLLGPALFLTSSVTIISQWLTRNKNFKRITIVSSTINVLTKVINLGLGIISKGDVYGFVIGDIVGKTLSPLLMLNKHMLKTIKELIRKFKINQVLNTANEFRKYPLVVLPGEYINMFSGQLPIYLISIYFGNKELGYFAFATNILGMPMGLLASAVRPVFFQKATSVYNENKERLGAITEDLFKYLFILGIIPFSVLTVFGDVIFAFAFGAKWTQAGLFAGILGYYYIFQLISSPISSILFVLKKEKTFFFFQVFLFFTRLLSLGIGIFILRNLITTLILFSVFNTLNYLILTIFVLKEVGLKYLRITLNIILVIILIFSFLYFLKYLLNILLVI